MFGRGCLVECLGGRHRTSNSSTQWPSAPTVQHKDTEQLIRKLHAPTRVVVHAVDALLVPLQRHVGGGVAQTPHLQCRHTNRRGIVSSRPFRWSALQLGRSKAAPLSSVLQNGPNEYAPKAPRPAAAPTLIVRSSEAEAKVLVSLGLNTSCGGRMEGRSTAVLVSREKQQMCQCP